MELDRVTPSLRTSCRTVKVGKQSWRELLFVHWEVPVDALRALVPPGLAIDTFEGRAYLGLVPFTMRDVRFGPAPLADFLETNLRTYVHAGGVPGVWFFSLEAESRLAVWGARTFFGLPYFRAEMHCERSKDSWDYGSRRLESPDAELDIAWSVLDADPHHAAPGTLEHFLTERYALYGPSRGQATYRVRVHHPSWPLLRARVDRLRTSIPRAAGLATGDPIDLVLASPAGVAVETFAPDARSLRSDTSPRS